jgi:hypothetical protein
MEAFVLVAMVLVPITFLFIIGAAFTYGLFKEAHIVS